MSKCRGPGSCHIAVWCDNCGDVADSCDNQECWLHWPVHNEERAKEWVAECLEDGDSLQRALEEASWRPAPWMYRADRAVQDGGLDA